jgi:GTP cyclohydrolase I
MVSRDDAHKAVKTLIEFIGDDPARPGLLDTPERFLKAWEQDWGKGYSDPPIPTTFPDECAGNGYDQMILVGGITFYSHCEHHLAPFFGTADIAYIPVGKRLIGLSKAARIVNHHARRLQVQERLTEEIAAHVVSATGSHHVGVILRAKHMCMMSRGVAQHNSDTVTSSLRGKFLTMDRCRAEFMKLAGHS